MDKGSGENMCQIPDRADGGEDKQKLEPYFFDDPSRRALERDGNDEGAAGSLGEPWGAPGSGQGTILEALEGPNDEACPGAASSPSAPTQMAGDEQVGSLYRHVQALHRHVQALHPLMSAPNASDSHMGFSVALHRLIVFFTMGGYKGAGEDIKQSLVRVGVPWPSDHSMAKMLHMVGDYHGSKEARDPKKKNKERQKETERDRKRQKGRPKGGQGEANGTQRPAKGAPREAKGAPRGGKGRYHDE